MSTPLRTLAPALCASLLLSLTLTVAPAAAAPLADDSGAEWQVEQPLPPAPGEAGIEASEAPVSLGHIGDVQFYAPNRGALITSGNGGSVKAGVWFYDGVRWRELSTQCGATDGRIAWAGPDEFWTVSDGRAGEAVRSSAEHVPLEDNTLCRFAPGPGGTLEIVASYASVPFLGSSYQPMHAAGCLTAEDCWFAGAPLPPPQVGTFMLHWDGASLEAEPYLPEGHAVWDMEPFEGRLFESMLLEESDKVVKPVERPAPLRKIKPTLSAEESPFESVSVPALYSPSEFSYALDYLRLSAAGEAIWAGTGPQLERSGGREAGVTIVRKTSETGWRRVIGPEPGEEEEVPEPAPPGVRLFGEDTLTSIAAEPGTGDAWIGLESLSDVRAESGKGSAGNRLARASLARVDAEGNVSDRLELPLPEDPHGPLGNVQRIVCPAEHDCWASTADGWLLHLASAAERAAPSQLSDPVFARIEAEEPITFRPRDEGVPEEPVDELPEDNSGETGFTRTEEVIKPPVREPTKVTVPLLTDVRTRVLHHTTLVLSFHLAVKADVRLLALRRKKVVAQTANKMLQAGNRSLQLKLNPKHWPEHLKLQTKALAALPTETTAAPNVNSVSTSVVAPARLLSTGLSF